MCLSTVSLAILLFLDFNSRPIRGKCSWSASASLAYLKREIEYSRLGDINIAASLSMTQGSCEDLAHVGAVYMSQVLLVLVVLLTLTCVFFSLCVHAFTWSEIFCLLCTVCDVQLVRTPPVIGAIIIDMLIVWNSLLRKVRS